MVYREPYTRHQLEKLAHLAARYGYLSSLQAPTLEQREERSRLFIQLIADWSLDPMEFAQPYAGEEQWKNH